MLTHDSLDASQLHQILHPREAWLRGESGDGSSLLLTDLREDAFEGTGMKLRLLLAEVLPIDQLAQFEGSGQPICL